MALSNKTKPAKKPFSFPRTYRITKRLDFLRLRKVSKKMVSRHWILYYAKNEYDQPRLAFSVSTKYGNAVARNRYRRWLREAFRLNVGRIPGYDLHFIARQKPANFSKKRYIEELNEDFEKLLHRLR